MSSSNDNRRDQLEAKNLIDWNRGPDGPNPLFRGTDVRLFDVLEQRGDGLSDAELMDRFPELNHEHLAAAVEYVEALRAEALSGDYDSQMIIAGFLEGGIGFPKDLAQAAIFWQLSAEAGNVSSQHLYANRLGAGTFGTVEKAQSLHWHRVAASNGHMVSQCEVGMALLNGDGIVKNPAEGARWIIRSANQGYAVAQGLLSMLHIAGKGVPQDKVLAYKWANLACAGGFSDLIDIRDSVASKLSPSEVEEAQRLCREWSAVEEP